MLLVTVDGSSLNPNFMFLLGVFCADTTVMSGLTVCSILENPCPIYIV